MTPHALIAELTSATIAGLWQGTALALLAAALLRLMPKASASLRHTLLLTIFAIAAILPWLHLGAAQSQQASAHALSIAPWFAAAIALAWLALASIRAVNLVLAWHRLRTVSQQAVPIVLEGIDGFQAGTRRAQLCTSPDVDSPTILGFCSPRLLLPDWMAPQLTQADLQQIALHECEHLRRRDDWLNLLLQIGLVLSPLNPALIWLDRRIALQRELACDAAVVAATTQPIAYATCLTRLAEQRMHHTRLALAMAAWGKQSELVQRVHALLTRPAQWTQRQSRLATCATAAVLVAGTVGLAHTPLAIHIADAPQLSASATMPVSMSRESTMAPGDGMPQGTRIVPASFIVQPVNAPAPRHKRKPSTQHRASLETHDAVRTPNFIRTTTLDTERPTAAFRRTASLDKQLPATSTAPFHSDPYPPSIRFVTTEFITPYIAVPVANGWLIFQL